MNNKLDQQHQPLGYYETNPFYIARDGIVQLFTSARGIFWAALVIGVVNSYNYIAGYIPTEQTEETARREEVLRLQTEAFTPEQWLVIALFFSLMLLSLLAAAVLVWGASGYTAYKLSEGKKVSIGEALIASLKSFWRLTAIAIITTIRVIGWGLLLIVPGFIMAFRYSLNNVIAFAEPNLSPSEAVSKSASLTKGAWLDVYAALSLVPLATLQLFSAMTDIGAKANLYRQLSVLKKSGADKPETSFLSHFTLALGLLTFLSMVLTVLNDAAQ